MTTTPRQVVWLVPVTIFIDAIGFGIVLSVLPSLVMALDHGTLAQATRIGGWRWLVYSVMPFLCGPIAGGLGDRSGGARCCSRRSAASSRWQQPSPR